MGVCLFAWLFVCMCVCMNVRACMCVYLRIGVCAFKFMCIDKPLAAGTSLESISLILQRDSNVVHILKH